MTIEAKPNPQSFEVADGDTFGDLLSANRIRSRKKLRIGLLAGGYFEFWRMYPSLKQKVEQDNEIVLRRLSAKHDVVCPVLVDTLDSADEAGRRFRDEQIDLLILAYRTYVPDVYIQHMLTHLAGVPLLLFASQSRDRFDYRDTYEGVLRNSGVMALVQLVAGFRKMDSYRHLEVVAGSVHDDEAYRQIDRYIDVVTIYKQLKTMTIGVIGNVFRGMFDFEYDKTKVKGALGPEVVNLQIDHLLKQWEQAPANDPDVRAMIKHAKSAYQIDGVGETDLEKSARLAVALKRLVIRFRLDGVALLCQHFLEAKLKTTPYLGLSELHREGTCPGVSEGDVIGLIMMKILKHLTGNTAFFLEWSEFDVERNGWMLLGHGFGDPSQARQGSPPKLTPTAEQWGLEGTGCSLELVPAPGPCTIGHFIEDANGWRMMISGGEIPDLPPLPIHDTHAFVRVERPIKEYVELLTKAGVPHHAITVRGDVRKELGQLADLMGMRQEHL
jgi:L-arabinose isomerase